MKETDFQEFAKMPRFSREVIITEKIDGTNAQILITPVELDEDALKSSVTDILAVADLEGRSYTIRAGSRNKWILPGKQDNAGFAGWVRENAQELIKLGEGRHYGEWWGLGIQRNYGMKEKVLSLFNVDRWASDELRPACCRVIPELWRGNMDDVNGAVEVCLAKLRTVGSQAAPGFMDPEGIIVWHTAGNRGYKKTIKNDDIPKSQVK
jgi:hypothetical protein